jgi:hypothetical protein
MSSLEINALQHRIMQFICNWARKNRTPIAKSEIIQSMEEQGVKSFTTDNALTSLLRKRYIQRAHVIDHRTRYIALRSV